MFRTSRGLDGKDSEKTAKEKNMEEYYDFIQNFGKKSDGKGDKDSKADEENQGDKKDGKKKGKKKVPLDDIEAIKQLEAFYNGITEKGKSEA